MNRPLSNNIVPPIPEPNEDLSAPAPKVLDQRYFHFCFWRIVLSRFFVSFPVALIFLYTFQEVTRAYAQLMGRPIPTDLESPGLLQSALVLTALRIVLLLPGIPFGFVAINREGFSCRGRLLLTRRLAWTEIGAIHLRRWLWMPTLLIEDTRHPRTVKIPLCVVDRAGFIAAVREFAPPDNPLRRYVEINVEPLKRDTMSR